LTNFGTDLKTRVANQQTLRDVVCLSHLRWNFVFQRPQHLMTRFATDRRVFFFEEPVFDSTQPQLSIQRDRHVNVVVPHLPEGLSAAASARELNRLLKQLVTDAGIDRPILWYYTPMALSFSRDIPSSAIVFDCMDELSAFHGAPRELLDLEAELIGRADLLFTGGQSLYEAKKSRHPRVFAFPSAVDVAHFAKARREQPDPTDQSGVAHPRLGFFGVIDERMDLALIDAVAESRPGWQVVLLGPTAKIDPAVLPRRANIHYLGMKKYEELPAYLSGWDVALLPFANNDATRFISPTKTPEYLAAGCPVVSTSVRDVVRPYGDRGLVEIADDPATFVAAVERTLSGRPAAWQQKVDRFLSDISWDRTWGDMRQLIDEVAARRALLLDAGLHARPLARPADAAQPRL
jgi:UDP-galactopyranose mutase